MRTGALAAAAVMLTAFGALSAFAACKLGGQTLPVTVTDLRPLIDAKINGQDVRFLVDSGAFYSVITPGNAAAFHLHLGPGPMGLTMEGIGGGVTPSLTTVKDFTVAHTDLHNVQFLVGGGETGQGTAGVLGQNILHVADDEYDLAKGVIRLVRAEGCGENPLAYWARGVTFSTLTLTGQDERFKMTKSSAFVNGQRISVIFDTGAGQSFLSLEAAKRAGIDMNAPGVISAGMTGGIGRRRVRQWIVPIQSFKIGDEDIRNTRIRVGDTSLPETDMLLGPDFFLSHHIYVANGQRKIYFTYNGGPVFDLRVNPGAQTTEANAPDSPDPHGESEPTSALGYSQRGEAFASRRDYARAIADLSRARDMEPQNALYAYQRGLAYRENAQPFLAMAEFEAALKLKPDYVDALLARAQLRFAGRDAAAARADLATVDKIVPTQSDARLALAALYSRSGDHAAAVPQYDQWIRAHPDDGRLAVALNGRCWAGAQLGADLDRALAACDSALRREPKNASFLDSRGLVHLRRGETDKAMEDYNAALAINPRIAWALYGRALAEQRKGQGDAAKADFAAASAISPVVAREAKERGIVS